MCALNAKQTTTESGFDKLNHWKKNSFSASAFAARCVEMRDLKPQVSKTYVRMGRANNAQFSTRGSREEAEKKKKTKTAQSNSVVK